jgi:hypothetical protein
LDYKSNEEILEELKVEPNEAKLGRYKSNWQQYVTRMNNMMPKIKLNSIQNGGRRLGRPWKRLLDEAETSPSGPDC